MEDVHKGMNLALVDLAVSTVSTRYHRVISKLCSLKAW